jgi:hypothetical protein
MNRRVVRRRFRREVDQKKRRLRGRRRCKKQ